MVLPATLGMLAGWALDTRSPRLEMILSRCGADTWSGLLRVLPLHWSCLPAMHAGMVGAVLIAVLLRRLAQRHHSDAPMRADLLHHAVGLLWMLVGMSAGSIIGEWAAMRLIGSLPLPLEHSAALIPVGMFTGMLLGMLAHTALQRAARPRTRAASLTP